MYGLAVGVDDEARRSRSSAPYSQKRASAVWTFRRGLRHAEVLAADVADHRVDLDAVDGVSGQAAP